VEDLAITIQWSGAGPSWACGHRAHTQGDGPEAEGAVVPPQEVDLQPLEGVALPPAALRPDGEGRPREVQVRVGGQAAGGGMGGLVTELHSDPPLRKTIPNRGISIGSKKNLCVVPDGVGALQRTQTASGYCQSAITVGRSGNPAAAWDNPKTYIRVHCSSWGQGEEG